MRTSSYTRITRLKNSRTLSRRTNLNQDNRHQSTSTVTRWVHPTSSPLSIRGRNHSQSNHPQVIIILRSTNSSKVETVVRVRLGQVREVHPRRIRDSHHTQQDHLWINLIRSLLRYRAISLRQVKINHPDQDQTRDQTQ